MGNYRSPLDIPLILAANFGELRPNHFHMGVDFKTNGKEGLNIHAIEDGYVSRINISPYSYGKVVYIAHPNGVTSVYAHCSSFKGQLDSLVKNTQEKEQSFEVEIYFTKNSVPVKKGEIIALSGNTGGSTAPHLHFELRETATEVALNPLVFGFDVEDHRAPVISAVKVYALDVHGYTIPGKNKTSSVKKTSANSYTIANTLSIPSDFCSEHGGIGLATEVVDYYDGATNVCGLYASELKVNQREFFGQRMNRIAFKDSRYINIHKDHLEYSKGRKFHKSFLNENNPLEIYTRKSDGIMHVKPGDLVQMEYVAMDIKKNKSTLQFALNIEKGTKNLTEPFPINSYFFPEEPIALSGQTVRFTAPAFTLYEPMYKTYSLTYPYVFGQAETPLQKPITIEISTSEKTPFSGQNYIEVETAKQQRKTLATTLKNNMLTAESKFLGTFRILTDSIPPELSPLNFTDKTTTITGKSILSWRVEERATELIDYDLFIDGKWQILEYEPKGDYLFFRIPKKLKGRHKLNIRVKDSCGNQRVWEKEMVFN